MKQGVSKIRNPVIARVFRELRLIEQWGSGVRRMFQEAKDQGLPDPEIIEIGMRVRFIVRLVEPLAIKKPKAQVGAQSESVLLALFDTPLSAFELSHVLGLETKTGAFKRSIKALLAQGLIEYTLPEKPNSRLQKYQLTDSGKAVLAARGRPS
jgi:ATP-dependent DNA helicase RecG